MSLVKEIYLDYYAPLKLFIRRHPSAYKVFSLFRGNSLDRLVDEDTDLCLEGVPRSANSFALHFVKNISPDLRVAHHTHSVTNLKLALRQGVPACILVREPLDAAVSGVIRNCSLKGWKYDPALFSLYAAHYEQFYGYVLGKREQFTVVSFSTVIDNYSGFVKKVEGALGYSLGYEAMDLEWVGRKAMEELEKHAQKKGTENSEIGSG